MPIYEFQCPGCGTFYEEIVLNEGEQVPCPECALPGTKVISASSSLTGREGGTLPGKNDHGCCGNRPGATGCVPGSCCGRA